MPEVIDRVAVRRLLDQNAQLVDVLPAEEFAQEHLPGAVSIPLKQLNANSTATLNANQAIIVYCMDMQ